MVFKIVIPAAILFALFVGMFSIILPKVEANEELSCVLFSGNRTWDPRLITKTFLPTVEQVANRVLNKDIPEQQPRFNSITCATFQNVGVDPTRVFAAQGMLSREGRDTKECSVRFYGRLHAHEDADHDGVLIDCPPSSRG